MHKAKKRFGQNFLVDEQIVADIIGAIRPEPQDNMVEIGPGLGALTRPLLKRLNHLHVVEIDHDIIARLEHDYPQGNPESNHGGLPAQDSGLPFLDLAMFCSWFPRLW